MKTLGFADLKRLPLVAFYEDAFQKATGVPLKVVPPGEVTRRIEFGTPENPACALFNGTPEGCSACLETQRRLLRGAVKSTGASQTSCFAGLTDVAVPVQGPGGPLAVILSGQFFRRQPTERDFTMVMQMIRRHEGPEWERELRQAYFATAVITADRFEAVLHLLEVFARYLAEHGSRQAMACADHEPEPVTNAKLFVQAHAEDPITLDQVVGHVHVSRFYFCKLFKKATGMTLTEYVARVRVEKAKTLLGNPSMRISEIVFAAGFGSIPQFNTVFKQQVGMAPSEFRASLKTGQSADNADAGSPIPAV